MPTLATIGDLGLLAPAQSARLSAAYLYLRRLENLLQGINDQQTQTLPADALNQARLAWSMDEADWPQLTRTLAGHMQTVRAVFDELIGDDTPGAASPMIASQLAVATSAAAGRITRSRHSLPPSGAVGLWRRATPISAAGA